MQCPYSIKGCGGCDGLCVSYEETLEKKQEALRKLFPDAFPILPADKPLHYRNKSLRTFSGGKGRLISGIYRAGTHQVVELRECALESRRSCQILAAATDLLRDMGLSAYNEDTHRGVLRHMQLRRAPATGEVLLTVITGCDIFPGGKEFASAIMKRFPEIKGVIQNVNDRDSSAVLGFRDKLLAGKDEIRDVMCDLHAVLTSRSFYQVNTPQAEKLYKLAVSYADPHPGETLLDAYCGIGLIGMLAARSGGQVTGIELVRPAIECATKAARLNSLDNIRFLCGDAVKALHDPSARYDTILVDPPRAGLSDAFTRALITHAPSKIVYVSCNPETLARDLSLLTPAGYTPSPVQPVDLFPFTPHVETVVCLSQQKPDDYIEIEIDLDEIDATSAETKATYKEIQNWVQEHHGFHVTNLNIAQVKQKHGIIERENYNKAKSAYSKQPGCPEEKVKAIEDAMRHFQMIPVVQA